MRGVSKILGTEQDIINNMSVDKAATKKLLIELRDTRYCWLPVGELAENDAGITDEVHKVQLEPVDGSDFMDPNAPMRRVQYEYKEDPNAHIFKMGLTVSKVNQYINACE